MKSSRKLSRRSFLTRVAGGAIVGGGALVALTGKAEAYQVTDSDQGPHSDPPGRGRGSNHIRGCTDADQGPNADQAGNGRGNRTSDNDSGPNADPANCGRRR
ncbi:MAG TPA: twin-arginine translocation signal domain-containing protein [Allosphingosinicella sp.]|nr:twin-arginine translocation signal domain-containing protein [Allosphingosinicella sp.]